MNITIPLDKMTINEKIQTMETLWDDLCRTASLVPSPPWHKQILNERENAIKNGNDEFIDWETAKKRIRNSLP